MMEKMKRNVHVVMYMLVLEASAYGIEGSNPSIGINTYGRVTQLARVILLYGRSWEFKSPHAHHDKNDI